MCEDKFMDTTYCRRMTHLPSAARWTMIFDSAVETLDAVCFESIINKEKVVGFMYQGALDAEDMFNRMKFSNYKLIEEIKSSINYNIYKEEIDKNWNEIRDRIQKYSRFPLFAG